VWGRQAVFFGFVNATVGLRCFALLLCALGSAMKNYVCFFGKAPLITVLAIHCHV
jgi:hypothetical protein